MVQFAYENQALIDAIVDAIVPFLDDDETVMYRRPFRWHTHSDGAVIPNGYEMFGADKVCEDNGWELVHDFRHVAVFRRGK